MYFDPYLYDDMWYTDEDWDPRQQGPQIELFPPIGEMPPFQPPIGTPQFGPRPPRPRPQRPRPPFFPPTQPGFPGPDGSQGIRRCLNRNTMIWLTNGRNFWFFPTNINQQSVIGFRWTRNGWERSSISRRQIQWFDCQ
jgi:hypothetical protein